MLHTEQYPQKKLVPKLYSLRRAYIHILYPRYHSNCDSYLPPLLRLCTYAAFSEDVYSHTAFGPSARKGLELELAYYRAHTTPGSLREDSLVRLRHRFYWQYNTTYFIFCQYLFSFVNVFVNIYKYKMFILFCDSHF